MLRKVIVMEGEMTGHAHVAEGRDVELLTEADQQLLNAPHGATITHEEHSVIELPPGKYVVGRVLEYDYDAEESRNVAD